ncbi:MAG: SGNH/GDSL hydrolase family protein [Sphingobacteriaceae bacterium]|nr:SGNH/GDSL hydrolase family protein [Sphingobacteriaceae bacterium]
MSKNIFFFGDSICFGQFISPHKTWVSKLSVELNKHDSDYIIFNPSHSGDTTRMVLEKMPFDVQQHGIFSILIQYGINDSNYWASDNGLQRVSQAAFKANLIEIIDRAKAFGAKKIFLDTNHPTNKKITVKNKKIEHQIGNRKYNQIIRQVALEKKVQLIDIERYFLIELNKINKTISHYLLKDGIHLNEEGHKLYYKIVFPYFKKHKII